MVEWAAMGTIPDLLMLLPVALAPPRDKTAVWFYTDKYHTNTTTTAVFEAQQQMSHTTSGIERRRVRSPRKRSVRYTPSWR
jgi:hypothetical protein